jgi:hypothetical protein
MMMVRLLASFALVVMLALPALANDPLSVGLPSGVPDGKRLGWEVVSGAIDTATESLVYTFYVNPARQAIYEVARYRFVKVDGTTRTPSTEKLVWNQSPSGGRGPQCYALEAGAWRTLERGSEEYRSEMGMMMHVYGVHRQVVTAR